MSLYIGNLSPRTRRDDLERVFGRFGRCNVRMKDGYGFAVYVFPPDAEKALRALQGRNICGQPLSLTWSNKQPRAFKRFARDDRSYEPLRRRFSARGGDYVNRNFVSDGNRDYKMGTKQPDRDGGRLSYEERSDNLDQIKDNIEEENNKENHDREDLQKEAHGFGGHLLDEGGSVEQNLVENGRWGEQVRDLSNDSGGDSRKEYEDDQYDAYQGYYKKEEDEGHHRASSNDSPLQQSYQEKKGRENSGEVTLSHHRDSKFKQICYSCGGLGHKSRSCSFGYTSRRNLAKHDPVFINDSKRDVRGQSEHQKIRSTTSRKRQTSEDTVRRRELRDGRKVSGSRKRPKLTRSGSSPMAKETDKAPKEDHGKKKYGRNRTKNTKRSVSSSLHSDYTSSKSQSASLSSKRNRRPHSRSRSRSVSSRIQSLTPDSKSSSTSHLSRSKGFSSRSRSSSPASLSLSVSLHQPLPAYPNEGKSNLRGSVGKGATPKSTKELIKQEQLVDVGADLEGAEPENMMVAVNENGVSSSKLGNEIVEDQTLQRDNDDAGKNFKAPDERTNLDSTMSEKGTLIATVSSSLESWKEAKENQASDPMHMPKEMEKLDFDSPCISHSKCPTSISPEELNLVLKHYGLKGTNESERQLPVEDYYGSSRLWPWEIIYYRRLKKGPISTENYSRRLAQNREFGITDKYIRSSSGWYEFGQDNLESCSDMVPTNFCPSRT
ncbi:hypothetical protein HS088_TW05G00498 [Tripterygium wilfordii]|uniref:Serine/arginine-rich splicing factor 4-like n=1 Tax=Tripterygium wilfordii TaxID=458696 RepID=A0A7J7DN54_TRIWF|nr:serine/arginine-rich splicing factor 4-like [Tripterygium wilfordii]KAF5747771.1 hypothetical protein HS088_TW05G00498 [Tripterygium wilfordii]